jgi:hypothetical protein
MTVDVSLSVAGQVGEPVVRPWERSLLWLGVPLCVAGLATTGIAAQWRGGRFAELIVLALASLALAALLRRALHWRMASGLALAWLVALAFFAGPLPTAATALLGSAALALGSTVDREAPLALRVAAGLTLCAGVLGWLLPAPLHYRVVYLVACVAPVAWRWRSLRASWREATTGWRDAVAAAPRASAFAVLVLGLASTGSWLPTMQADDVVYHLRLPWQLMESHRYPLDPALHMWSLAPWAGDVLQALAQVLAGEEARGPLNMLWIALTATGLWRIVIALRGTARAAWFAVALYASLPLTAALAGGMQTETPTAALLAWLAWTILDPPPHPSRRLWLAALLFGGLLALKLAAALLALLLLPWALWRRRPLPSPGRAALALAIALAIGGSSYLYAWQVAHNPVLPLFNAWFQSPYYPPVNFDDMRWHAGFDAALPWNLTFHTDRYLEAFPGGGGFVLVALAGAWLLALLRRGTTAAALMATVLLVLPLWPMQYLRYVFPALVLLLAPLAVAAFRTDARRAAWLLAGVCGLNLAFQANAFWLLRVGAMKATVLAAGRDAPVFAERVPERNLIAAVRGVPHGNVLALDPERPYVAELGARGRSVSGYDRTLQAAAQAADADAGGEGWVALLRREGITDVLLRPAVLTPAQRTALARIGAAHRQTQGDIEWWRIPQETNR